MLRMRGSSPLLDIICRCIATAYVAKAANEPRLSLESQKLYVKALTMLQKSIYSEESASVETLSAVLSLTLYEVISIDPILLDSS